MDIIPLPGTNMKKLFKKFFSNEDVSKTVNFCKTQLNTCLVRDDYEELLQVL